MKVGSGQPWRRAPAQGEGYCCAPALPPRTFIGKAGKGGAGGKKAGWWCRCGALEPGGKAGNAGKKALARGGTSTVQ
jgi:hypothetical protein